MAYYATQINQCASLPIDDSIVPTVTSFALSCAGYGGNGVATVCQTTGYLSSGCFGPGCTTLNQTGSCVALPPVVLPTASSSQPQAGLFGTILCPSPGKRIQ